MPEKDGVNMGAEESRAVLNGVIHSESSRADTDASLNQVDKMEHVMSDDRDDAEVGEDAGKDDVFVDAGKDDMFVDAPEELNADSKDQTVTVEREDAWHGINPSESNISQSENGVQDHHMMDDIKHLQVMLEKTVREKEIASRAYEEEKENYVREISDLYHQLKTLTHYQQPPHENGTSLVDYHHGAEFGDGEERLDVTVTSVRDLISECSKFIRKGLEERSQMEGTIRELHSALYMKDHQIGDLNAKIAELSVSPSVVDIEKDQHIEAVATRMLESLNFIADPEEPLEDSVCGKINLVERRTAVLSEKYNLIFSQIDQLRQCICEGNLQSVDFDMQDGSRVVSAVHNELLEVKRREVDLIQKVRNVEDENRKLVEQLNNDKMSLEESNAELSRVKLELEQEKTRLGNVKEKLSLAVTKGKSLVQQRDSLKQVLADKTSELERCLSELQTKSSALEAAEVTKEELKQNENLVALLQENLSQRNEILIKFEKIMSDASLPAEVQHYNIVEKCRWLLDDRNRLKDISGEFQKFKDALSIFELPESVSASDPGSMVAWLRESLDQAKRDAETLQDVIVRTQDSAQNEIDRLSASLSGIMQEKGYLQIELDDLNFKYDEIVEKVQQVSSDKEHMLLLLLEASGDVVSYQGGNYREFPLSDYSGLLNRCFENIRGKSSSPDYSHTDLEVYEKIRSLLYVRDLELTLCEKVLEEEMLVRSQEVHKFSSELEVFAKELSSLKEEKSSIQKDLERSEEKSAMLREKLSMAVKKGKGLVQDRENLRRLLEEKNAEIEKLKLEVQQQESVITDCRDQISSMLSRIECIPKLETDLVSLKDQRDKLEQFLLESNNMLQRVIESVDGITFPVESVSDEPADKVKWLVACFTECKIAKDNAEQELSRAQEEAGNLASRLAEACDSMKRTQSIEQDFENLKEEASKLSNQLLEAQAIIENLEASVASSHNNILLLAEEKRELEFAKLNAEKDLQEAMREEANNLSNQFAEAQTTIRNLETALASSHNDISLLNEEKRELEVAKLNVEKNLQEAIRQVNVLSNQLVEAQDTIRSLEDALAASQNSLSLLAEEKKELEVAQLNIEKVLQEATREASLHASNYTEVCASKKLIEDALLHAETKYGAVVTEKEAAEVSRDNAMKYLDRLKEELSIHHGKLAEADETIKSLEGAAFEREGTVDLLTEQRDNLEHELKKLQHEADSKTSTLTDAFATIKSLEDALLKAEDHISTLVNENKQSQEEISAISTKLSACLEELAGKSGSVESSSLELLNHLNQLELLMKDENLYAIMKKSYMKSFEHLKDMDLILDGVRSQIVDLSSEALPNEHISMDESVIAKPFPGDDGDMLSLYAETSGTSAVGGENILSSFQKTLEKFELKNRILIDRIESFSTFLDEIIAVLLKKSEERRREVMAMVQEITYLRGGIKKLETGKLEQEQKISMLEDDVAFLLSACTDANRELQLGLDQTSPSLVSVPEIETSDRLFAAPAESGGVDAIEKLQKLESSRYVKPVEELLFTARKVQVLVEQFEKTSNAMAITIHNLENELEEVKIVSEKATEERDSCQNMIYKLEAEVEALQNSCSKLEVEAVDFKAGYEKLKEREAEVSSMYNDLLLKQQESEDSLLSTSEVVTLFDKINGLHIPSSLELPGRGSSDRSHVKKLFYIIDYFPQLENQIYLLSQDKDKLQPTLASHALENEHLKKEVEVSSRYKLDSEMTENELSELTSGLVKFAEMLGVSELVGDKKSAGVNGLLDTLEKQIMNLLLEFENSKSRAQELGTKLLGSQKLVDELSTKVKSLEGSVQVRSVHPEPVQERSVFEATALPSGSEISEIEDVEPVGKKLISPVPSAPHVRTMRKGSTDHLALNIDTESDQLINTETDEGKGYKFKSLNTSGLIPKQGKLIADRIDGLCVSGGSILMSRPGARVGIIAYWLFLHMWLLGTIIL